MFQCTCLQAEFLLLVRRGRCSFLSVLLLLCRRRLLSLLLPLVLRHAERVVEPDKVLVLEARSGAARLQVEPLGARRHLLGDLPVDPAQAAGVDAPYQVLQIGAWSDVSRLEQYLAPQN